MISYLRPREKQVLVYEPFSGASLGTLEPTTLVESSVVMNLPRSLALTSSACHTGIVEVMMPFPAPVTIRPT